MTLAAFLSALGAFTTLAWSPGPAVIAAAHAAMAQGFAAAARLSLGLALGVTLWGLLAAAGLGALLVASERALAVVRLLGGVYLLWLAWMAARSALASTPPRRAPLSGFRAGLLLNLANPRAVFTWAAVLSFAADTGVLSLLALVIVCGASALAGYLLWAAALSRDVVRAAYGRLRRWIDGTLAALFGLAGIELIRLGAAR